MKLSKRDFFVLFLFFFFSASAALKSQDNVKEGDIASRVENIFRTANRHIGSGDFNRARAEYGKISQMKEVGHAAEFALFNVAESYRIERNYAAAHKAYDELMRTDGLTSNYRIYCLFAKADTFLEEKKYDSARKLYSEIVKRKEVSANHASRAEMLTGDTYRFEKKYRQAREVFEKLLKREDRLSYPDENFRLELSDRLEALDGMKDGQEEKDVRQRRSEWVESPKVTIYVSPEGNDGFKGTKESPFGSIERAREEVRRIKKERGMPEGGISVYLRGGKYFVSKGMVFEEEDSGTESSPVVWRSYPGEDARLIGGRQINNFKLIDDPDILRRLPGEARGRVWVSDLKAAGIKNYGNLRNRGSSWDGIDIGAMELFYNSSPMLLSRWPDEGWERVFDLVTPEGDGSVSGYFFQKGRFRYSGERPKRWTEEKDIWAAGYFMWPWDKMHTRVVHIDTEKSIVNLSPDIRWWAGYGLYSMPVVKDTPYYFYNVLAEISIPGEFYIDRDAGKLYFYPPGKIEGNEIIVSTLDSPIVKLERASHMVFHGLTFECTWRNAVTLDECADVLLSGNVIRNTGNLGVTINDGWRNGIAGCDIYDTGEGGIRVSGGDMKKLLPGGHYVENNHIYRFNRFSHGGGKTGITISGVGNRVSHNLMHDSSYNAIFFSGNNHVVEYNEIYDVMNEGRDGGAIYTHCGSKYLTNRGNVMRYNFIHNITEHSSPLKTHQVTGLYVDSLNGAMTMKGNVFYRCTERAMFTHGPDTRIEDNIFVDCRAGITQSNRTYLLREERPVRLWKENTLDTIRHRQPPWAERYPQVSGIFERKPYGEPVNIFIERNIHSGTPPASISGDFLYDLNRVANNIEGQDIYFLDRENLNFGLAPGSPVYAVSSFEPLPFGEIGLYPDPLRASWPAKRSPAGKYYKADWKAPVSDVMSKFPRIERVSREKEYEVSKRVNPIRIDGVLSKEEWSGLDKDKAIAMDEEHLTGVKRETPGSYAWITHDEENIYIGIEHVSDPWREGMPKEKPVLMHEFALEGSLNQDVWWWQEGVPTGPLFVFSGRPDGRFIVHNLFSAPADVVAGLQRLAEYKAVILDGGNCHWTAEWKIPLSCLKVDLSKKRTSKFNMGLPLREGWFAWVATGSAIWRVDNAGLLRFK